MKRITMFLLSSFLLISVWQFVLPSEASAEDCWVYGTEDGTSYWVDSDTAYSYKGGKSYGLLKTVVDDQCVDRTGWMVSQDEGYIWACKKNEKRGFAIYAAPAHWGNEPVYDRPELLALYYWLINNAQPR